MIEVQAKPGMAFRFAPDVVVATVAVTEGILRTHDDAVRKCLDRHFQGDWGDVSADSKFTNDVALADGDSLMSAYSVGGTTIWVITDARRPGTAVTTTILYPQEF